MSAPTPRSGTTGVHMPQDTCALLLMWVIHWSLHGNRLLAYLNKLTIFPDQCLNTSPPREEVTVHQPKPVPPPWFDSVMLNSTRANQYLPFYSLSLLSRSFPKQADCTLEYSQGVFPVCCDSWLLLNGMEWNNPCIKNTRKLLEKKKKTDTILYFAAVQHLCLQAKWCEHNILLSIGQTHPLNTHTHVFLTATSCRALLGKGQSRLNSQLSFRNRTFRWWLTSNDQPWQISSIIKVTTNN